MKKEPRDMDKDGVVVEAWLGCERGGKGESQKHAFRSGARFTFIISMTFARSRYSLIV